MTTGKERFLKSDAYDCEEARISSVRDPVVHASQRKALSHAFSARALRDQEDDINGFQPSMIANLQSLMQLAPATPFLVPSLLSCQLMATMLSKLQLWLPWRPVSRPNRLGCPISARKVKAAIIGMKTHSLEDARLTGPNLHADSPLVVWCHDQSHLEQIYHTIWQNFDWAKFWESRQRFH